jgi:acyl-coenzyme A synthetase/AMP-(fatty) acid ligase
MNVLPLSFGYGLTQLFSSIKVGARFVLEKGIAFPHVTLSRMAAERVTGFAMVPTIAAVILDMDLSRYDLQSLRYITNAGAGLPTEHGRRLRAALPHVHLVLMYGQTECLRISYLEPSEVDRRPDSVGKGMPNQELQILNADGEPVAANEVGELVVRGSHVMRGYWRMPAETAATLRPGRFPGEYVHHTGDLFRRDEEGYLYFVARGDDIIKCKGEKVSPREVENALYRLDGVAEAAVVGVPHPVFGQAVKAVVVLRSDVRLEVRDVQRHCASCLEDFMVPAVVEFVDALPKSDNGKILKASLRQ